MLFKLMTFSQIFFISLFSISWNKSTEKSWSSNFVIIPKEQVTEPKIAVLIIQAPSTSDESKEDFITKKWRLGIETWKKYMHVHPSIDCYFVKPANHKTDDGRTIWIEEDTINVYDHYYKKRGRDRILYKTIKALDFLSDKYTHFVRTNLNTFWNLHELYDYIANHSGSYYTGPAWENGAYPIGYGIIMTQDVAQHIIEEYHRLEKTFYVCNKRADDAALMSLAYGVDPWIIQDPFRKFPKFPTAQKLLMSKDSGVSKEINYDYACLLQNVRPLNYKNVLKLALKAPKTCILYRSRGDGLNLEEIQMLYDELLKKTYALSFD
jgi:hypothetical protein